MSSAGAQRPLPARRTRATVPVLFGLFLLLLGVVWVVTNPPGAGGDERAHYIKAVGAGGGDLRGKRQRVSPVQLERLFEAAKRPGARAQIEAFFKKGQSSHVRWQQRTSREFSVPAGLGFSGFGCGRWHPESWADCLERGRLSTTATDVNTYAGTYQPYVYIAPGLAIRSTRNAVTGLRLGRLVNAALSLGLVALAGFLLWDRSRGALSLAGLFVALTPAVVFFCTTLTPSGPEIASGVCFAASLIRLARRPDRPSWVWLACAVSGAVLALSRSLGPFFVALAVLTVVALVGRRRASAALRSAPRQAIAAAVAIAIAAAAGAFWELKYQPGTSSEPEAILADVGPSIEVLPRLAKEAVAFGALNIPLPLTAYLVWWLMLGVLLVTAFAVTRRRERGSLVALCAWVLAVTIGLAALYSQRGGGFELQARYVLPFAVVLPLWAGELVNRRRRRLGQRRSHALIAGLAGAAAVVHLLVWHASSRRAAVGYYGDWLFALDAEWLPPLGWIPWIILVLAATGTLVLTGVRAGRALEW